MRGWRLVVVAVVTLVVAVASPAGAGPRRPIPYETWEAAAAAAVARFRLDGTGELEISTSTFVGGRASSSAWLRYQLDRESTTWEYLQIVTPVAEPEWGFAVAVFPDVAFVVEGDPDRPGRDLYRRIDPGGTDEFDKYFAGIVDAPLAADPERLLACTCVFPEARLVGASVLPWQGRPAVSYLLRAEYPAGVAERDGRPDVGTVESLIVMDPEDRIITCRSTAVLRSGSVAGTVETTFELGRPVVVARPAPDEIVAG